MNDKEKIKQYLENNRIAKNKFYVEIGLSTGFLDSGKSLSVEKLRKITDKYPDILSVLFDIELKKNDNASDSKYFSLLEKCSSLQDKIIALQQENSELKLENERLKSAFTSDATVPYAGSGCKTG